PLRHPHRAALRVRIGDARIRPRRRGRAGDGKTGAPIGMAGARAAARNSDEHDPQTHCTEAPPLRSTHRRSTHCRCPPCCAPYGRPSAGAKGELAISYKSLLWPCAARAPATRPRRREAAKDVGCQDLARGRLDRFLAVDEADLVAEARVFTSDAREGRGAL